MVSLVSNQYRNPCAFSGRTIAGVFLFAFDKICARLAYMTKILLKEWAALNGMSRRKAEYLAERKIIPVTKERISYSVSRWAQVIDRDYKIDSL